MQTDIIVYGENLYKYLAREFGVDLQKLFDDYYYIDQIPYWKSFIENDDINCRILNPNELMKLLNLVNN